MSGNDHWVNPGTKKDYDQAVLAAEVSPGDLKPSQKALLQTLTTEHSPRGKAARKALGLE